MGLCRCSNFILLHPVTASYCFSPWCGLLIFKATVELERARCDMVSYTSQSLLFLLIFCCISSIHSLDCGKPFTNFQSSKKVDLTVFASFLIPLTEENFWRSLLCHFSDITPINFLTSLKILFWVTNNHFTNELWMLYFVYLGYVCKSVPLSLLTIIWQWANYNHSNVPLYNIIRFCHLQTFLPPCHVELLWG